MSNELARMGAQGITPHSFDEAERMATALAKAVGFVPRDMANRQPAVLAAILTGAELGIGPMEAMRSIHLIKGKPTLDASLMLKLAIRAGVKPQWLEHSATAARLKLTREGFKPHEHSFTMEDAKRAGLSTDTWRKYPAAMLRARCLSAAMRAFCPDVLGGSVYVEGELGESDPPPPAARLVTPEPEPEPASVEEQLEEVEGETVDEPEAAPAKLPDCASEIGLRRWCAQHAEAVIETHGDKARRAILKQGAAIGVPESVVSTWIPAAAA